MFIKEIAYPGINSRTAEGDNHMEDFVVPALVFNRYNIRGGVSFIYDEFKNELDKDILEKYDFTLLNDKELYHYVSPIQYYESDGFEDFGFRDILGLDIHIIE